MSIALVGARVLTPDEDIPRANVLSDDAGRIIAVGADVEPPPAALTMDVGGLTLAPGFIDTHVHGGGGFSLASGDPDEIRAYARWVAAKGVTSFVATIVGDSPEQGLELLPAAASLVGRVAGGASLLGLHLEGPFVNPQRRGALPASWLSPPDALLLRRYIEAARGHLRLLTLAPELAGAGELIAAAQREGIVVSMGHTEARYEEARAAIEAGVLHVTHCFNAMRPFHHREPGPLGAILESPRVTAEVIADGVHVHAAALRLLLQAKGPPGVVLVTDGIPAAGQGEGTFVVGGQEVQVREGHARLADGRLAGSLATMDQVVGTVVRLGLASLPDAIRMASTNPARLLGQRKGRLAPGFDADLVALDDNLAVAMTWVGGEMLYFRPQVWRG